MRVVVFAYSDIGCCGIEELLAAKFKIQAIFTHQDNPKENRFFASVAELGAKHDLPLYAPEDVNHPIWVERLKNFAPDLIFSFYYRHLLGKQILSIPQHGAYNLHGSLLPLYRGRVPLNWVLVNGEKETGVTLHKMVSRADAGGIVAQSKVYIENSDTAPTLHHKLCQAARSLLSETLPLFIQDKITIREQDESKATIYGRRITEDGIIDWNQAAEPIHNLVRAVTTPFPGAYTFIRDRKLIIWQTEVEMMEHHSLPGTVISTAPLRIACGQGVVKILSGQADPGIRVHGAQLSDELGITAGKRLGTPCELGQKGSLTRVLILGVNGFIGNHLTERLLQSERYEVYGLDIGTDAISRFIGNPRFHFVEGDIGIHTEWIEYHIKKCDVVLPLVAIATPIEYVRNPLKVFELDFEENLKIVRYCVKYQKRIIFPSTSEVYGMCDEEQFDEDRSRLILGPINKQRWIYSSVKQLLDRVIWAYGQERGLDFTLFRPFNWMGPRLDSLQSARIGSSRAITQLILNLVEGSHINLIDGGKQRRCFTDIDDGIEALFRIIENQSGHSSGKIINIGNPDNEASIQELATMLLRAFDAHPLRQKFPPFAGFKAVESHVYYGSGYQDVSHRRPSIANARRYLNWKPNIPIEKTVEKTLDFFLSSIESLNR